MKRIYVLAIVASIMSIGSVPVSQATSFFRPQPISQDLVVQNAMSAFDTYHKRYEGEKAEPCKIELVEDKSSWSIQPKVFYFHGTGQKHIARYFFPAGKAAILVAQNNTSDVSCPWLKILTEPTTPFIACVTTRPRCDRVGGAFTFRYDRGPTDFLCSTIYPWVSIFVPITHVRNKLEFCETIKSVPGLAPGFPDLYSALNNPEWNFGKFSRCTQTKTGVDDVLLALGCDFVRSPCFNFGTFGLFFIPTGSRSKACKVWEPVIGSGPHVGLGAGLRGDTTYEINEESELTSLAEFRYAYFLKGRERRSFDLTNNGDWSRYLLVCRVEDLQQCPVDVRPLPGINYFTRNCEVTPRSTINLWLAAHYNRNNWHCEAGYALWWRQREKIRINPCDQGIAIFDITGSPAASKTSASTATIKGALPGPGGPRSDAVITPVKPCALNPCSGATTPWFSSTIYGAVSHAFTTCCYPGSLGVGVSYTFAQSRGAMSEVGVWLTSGIYF